MAVVRMALPSRKCNNWLARLRLLLREVNWRYPPPNYLNMSFALRRHSARSRGRDSPPALECRSSRSTQVGALGIFRAAKKRYKPQKPWLRKKSRRENYNCWTPWVRSKTAGEGQASASGAKLKLRKVWGEVQLG